MYISFPHPYIFFKINCELLLLLARFLHHQTGHSAVGALGDLGRDSEDFDEVATIATPQRWKSPNHRRCQQKTQQKRLNMTWQLDNFQFMHKLLLSQYFGRFFGELHLIQTVTPIRFLYKLNGNLTKKITFISLSTQCICCFGKPAF